MMLLEVVTCGCMRVDRIDKPVLSTSSENLDKRRQRKSNLQASTMMWKPSLDAIPENGKLAVPPAKPGSCRKVGHNIEKAGALRTAKPSPAVEERCRYDHMRDVFSAFATTAFGF
ncbi:hypothetical protein IEQ34_016550 [Dendrobium chrysotoxum]|uniref:Uncharacterized protein n=1 Tax=Dendrobium chrysotoxum TaxID=161865 RepID=A0AAV7GEW3_DENCH|nr:hypothetical protein IEQ34_016550 [Dendrobium chrysotoxum]